MNKKQSIIIISLVLLIIFGFVWYENNDYARITDVEYKAVVVDEPGDGGKVVITERITFDIHAASASNGFWELWRDLCEDDVDGLRVKYKVNSVKQIMPDGTAIEWAESPKLYWDDYDYISPKYGPNKWYHSPGPYDEYAEMYECVFFYVDNVYREKMTFEIEYEMPINIIIVTTTAGTIIDNNLTLIGIILPFSFCIFYSPLPKQNIYQLYLLFSI